MVDGGANGGKEELFSEVVCWLVLIFLVQSKVLAATIVNTFNNDTVYALNSTRAPTYGSRMALRYLTNVNYQNIGTVRSSHSLQTVDSALECTTGLRLQSNSELVPDTKHQHGLFNVRSGNVFLKEKFFLGL